MKRLKHGKKKGPMPDYHDRELRLGRTLLFKFERAAPNEEKLLTVFQEENWTHRVDNPFPGTPKQAREKLHNVVTRLNRRMRVIHFRLDGTGEGVTWELVRKRK